MFQPGNREWRKRRLNRGGRPSREAVIRRKALDKAEAKKIKFWAEARAKLTLVRILGKGGRCCPLCERRT
jgi:hypothetical protein